MDVTQKASEPRDPNESTWQDVRDMGIGSAGPDVEPSTDEWVD